jgi:hypothetical protein
MGGNSGFKVVTRAIRDEANQRWGTLAVEMATIARNARNLTLKESAFWAGPSTYFAYGHDIPPPGGPTGLPVGGPMMFPSGGRSSRSFDAPRYADEYSKFREFVANRLDEAVKEFEQIKDTLLKIANKYDRMNKIGELNLKEVWTAAQEAKPPGAVDQMLGPSIRNLQKAMEQAAPRRKAASDAGSGRGRDISAATVDPAAAVGPQNLMPTVQGANWFGSDRPRTDETDA